MDGHIAPVLETPRGATRHSPWELISISGGVSTEFARPLCGERGDHFLVSVRLIQEHNNHRTTRKSGYREMYSAVTMASRTTKCNHTGFERMDAGFPLPLGTCATAVQADGDIAAAFEGSRIVICLPSTSNAAAGKWRSLLAAAYYGDGLTLSSSCQSILRTRDCCGPCAIQQTLLQPAKCVLIL